MNKTICIFCLVLAFSIRIGLCQETMNPARFQQIVKRSGDTAPLVPELASVPFWTNAVVSNVMIYTSGKVFQEEMTQTAHTVDGKYLVFTAGSKFYHQIMNAVLAFDKKESTLKLYGLYGDGHGGDVVTEGEVVYDYTRKTYTITSSYGEGYKETTNGSYTEKADYSKTLVYKDGSLFLTREVWTRPAETIK